MATTTAGTTHQPNPELIFSAFNAYQRTFALKGAIELEVFTHIADGATSSAEIAKRASADARAMRILCDYLTIEGFLTKESGAYGLTPESATFLNKHSPAYMGTIAKFLTTDAHFANYRDVAAVVRKGGTLHGHGNMEPDNEIWVEFAQSMVPIMMPAAQALGPLVTKPDRPAKILDIAAGHGMYGIMIGVYNRAAQIVGVDWKNVLEVAKSNAARLGVADRYRTVPGSAFDVELGTGYDVVLLPNFLHHFDAATNVGLLKKIHAAMKPGGTLATIEFVPNEDRVTPPVAAAFSFMMLGSTEHGDAYTFREFDKMFRDAGFGESRIQGLPTPEMLILTARP
ncbi:MAG TPA: class I SAM-dependent methyltransferase [Bryobacteraceae bacterium]|nr:class I SAM-dependent methyltransferase [Bryobacteraceae bacterium]